MIYELVADFRDALSNMPNEHAKHKIVQLLDKAIRRDAAVIKQRPHLLLQCLWHACYWHDSPRTPEHCAWKNDEDAKRPNWPWNGPGRKLCEWMVQCVEQSNRASARSRWLRSSRPGGAPLNSPLEAVLRGHEWIVRSVAVTPDGQHIVSGSWDKTVRVWEASDGRELSVLRGHDAGVERVAVTPDGREIFSREYSPLSPETELRWDMPDPATNRPNASTPRPTACSGPAPASQFATPAPTPRCCGSMM
jgi:hypothetical protein